MNFDWKVFIIDNLEAAGVIGGYVSISIIGVALITLLAKEKIESKGIVGPKSLHPIFGALLGVIPGCGGTIIASSLYNKQKITFGGLFAAFITTLGEGSFVLLGASKEADVAKNIEAFIIITIVGLIVGILAGYVFDQFGVRSKSKKTNLANLDTVNCSTSQSKTIAQRLTEDVGFYLLLAMAAFLVPQSIVALWGGSVGVISEWSVYVSIAFAAFSIAYYFLSKYYLKSHDCSFKNDVKSTLLHAVFDIVMVVTFVFIGLVITNFIIDVWIGVDRFNQILITSGFVVVLIAALIGVTPGCGGMIAVTVAYITIPNFPIAALIAAAIATSGDGIFALIAVNKKDGLLVSVASLILAIVVGYTLLVIEL